MKMPFGRWRNFEIEDVPQQYLAWLLRKANLQEPFRGAVTYELDRRLRERRQMVAAVESVGTF